MTRAGWVLPSLLLCCTTGCFGATGSKANIAPLETTYPVSASASYVDARGAVVTENHYRIVQSFTFEQTQSLHVWRDGVTLRLEPDLDRIMKATPGDAVTRLTVRATFDPSGTSTAKSLQFGGWVLLPMGGLLLSGGAALGEYPKTQGAMAPLVAAGAVASVAAVACWVVAVTRSNSWKTVVTGQVVKLQEPGAAPP